MKREQLQQRIVGNGETRAEERRLSDEISELRGRQRDAFDRLWGFANSIKDAEQTEWDNRSWIKGTRVNIVLDKDVQDPVYGKSAILKAEICHEKPGNCDSSKRLALGYYESDNTAMVVRYSLLAVNEGGETQVAEERFHKGLYNPGESEKAGNYWPDSSMHGLNIARAQLCPTGEPAYWERVDETLGLLEQAAQNPELNPVLAERLGVSERAALYS